MPLILIITRSRNRIMKKLQFLVVLAAIALLVAGCNSTYRETTKSDGTKVVTKKKESVLKDKTFASASNIVGIQLETSASANSSNILPVFRIATGGNTIVSSPEDSKKLVMVRTMSAGILNSITNSSATSQTMIFIGAENDTGDGAAKFINALASLDKAGITTATDADVDADETTATAIVGSAAADSSTAASTTAATNSAAATETTK